MVHMQALCKEIGPRPPTSAQERRAAEYVKNILNQLGYKDIQEQVFRSQNSLGWVILMALLYQLIAMVIGWTAGPVGKLSGALLLFGSACLLRETLLAKPPFFQRLIARGKSQNISVQIPAAGASKRKIFLVGHLDTQKQRIQSPPFDTGLFLINGTMLILIPVLGGLSFFVDLFVTQSGIPWWEWLIGALMLLILIFFLVDEMQPHIEGANDNATAVSVLLTIAEILQTKPLQHSDVTLLFTGCEEVLCVGMENYLQQHQPPRENTYWIDLEMVGTGNLCYITKHGVTYLSQYTPTPEMVRLAAQTAQKVPSLGVIGKEMVILEEVANLRNRGYQAICLAGYNEKGHLPNWHRLSDNLEHIEPETLGRACHFTLAFLDEIDKQ